MIKLSHKQAVVVGLGANPVSVVGDDGEVEVEVAAVGVVLQLVYNVDGTVLCRDRDRPSGRSRHRARSLESLRVLLEDLSAWRTVHRVACTDGAAPCTRGAACRVAYAAAPPRLGGAAAPRRPPCTAPKGAVSRSPVREFDDEWSFRQQNHVFCRCLLDPFLFLILASDEAHEFWCLDAAGWTRIAVERATCPTRLFKFSNFREQYLF